MNPDLQARIAEVRRRLPLAGEIERAGWKLSGTSGTKNRRGKCQFHGSNSASFSVKADFARCFGCGWNGDVVRFVREIMGLEFIDALKECELRAGISREGAGSAGTGMVHREKAPQPRKERRIVNVEPIAMARWIWGHAVPDLAAVRRYFLGRGVPERALTDARLSAFRYLSECPCWAWPLGEDDPRKAKRLMVAPAIMAMVTEPVFRGRTETGVEIEFVPVGLHVTYLNPEGTGTMQRRAPWAGADDPDPMLPKRRMLGPVGHGAIILGAYSAGAHLFVGEGNETVLSAIGLASSSEAVGGKDAGAGDDVIGVATLSLDNLQGHPKKWKNGIWPLHQIEPDPERGPFLIPGHRGPVTGLIDSDMSPLRGMRDQRTGEFLGEKLVTRKGGPIVQRAITGAERAAICADLVVKGWRAAGAHPVRALRAPMGMDFNDAAVSAQEGRA